MKPWRFLFLLSFIVVPITATPVTFRSSWAPHIVSLGQDSHHGTYYDTTRLPQSISALQNPAGESQLTIRSNARQFNLGFDESLGESPAARFQYFNADRDSLRQFIYKSGQRTNAEPGETESMEDFAESTKDHFTEVNEGSLVFDKISDQISKAQLFQQDIPNQIRLKHETQGGSNHYIVQQIQNRPNQVQQTSWGKPQFTDHGQGNKVGSTGGARSNSYLKYDVVGNVNQSPQEGTSNGPVTQPLINNGGNYGSSSQMSNGVSNTYNTFLSELAQKRISATKAISLPLFELNDKHGSQSVTPYRLDAAEGRVPDHDIKEILNIASLITRSQVSGKNVVPPKKGASSQFSVQQSQEFIPMPDIPDDIIRDPIKSLPAGQVLSNTNRGVRRPGNHNGFALSSKTSYGAISPALPFNPQTSQPPIPTYAVLAPPQPPNPSYGTIATPQQPKTTYNVPPPHQQPEPSYGIPSPPEVAYGISQTFKPLKSTYGVIAPRLPSKPTYKVPSYSHPSRPTYEVPSSAQQPNPNYGVPTNLQAPKENYGVPPSPQTPKPNYGIPSNPQTPKPNYGIPSNPQTPKPNYGIPSNPQTPKPNYGIPPNPQTPKPNYGAPSPSHPPKPTYGAPSFNSHPPKSVNSFYKFPSEGQIVPVSAYTYPDSGSNIPSVSTMLGYGGNTGNPTSPSNSNEPYGAPALPMLFGNLGHMSNPGSEIITKFLQHLTKTLTNKLNKKQEKFERIGNLFKNLATGVVSKLSGKLEKIKNLRGSLKILAAGLARKINKKRAKLKTVGSIFETATGLLIHPINKKRDKLEKIANILKALSSRVGFLIEAKGVILETLAAILQRLPLEPFGNGNNESQTQFTGNSGFGFGSYGFGSSSFGSSSFGSSSFGSSSFGSSSFGSSGYGGSG